MHSRIKAVETGRIWAFKYLYGGEIEEVSEPKDSNIKTNKIYCKTERGAKITAEQDLKRRINLGDLKIIKKNSVDFILQD